MDFREKFNCVFCLGMIYRLTPQLSEGLPIYARPKPAECGQVADNPPAALFAFPHPQEQDLRHRLTHEFSTKSLPSWASAVSLRMIAGISKL